MIETNFNGHRAIPHVVVNRIGYDKIDLDLIERGKSQARQEKVNVGIEDLALSIRVQGLMEPVHLVKIGDTGKYELIDGQRRFQAFNILRDENSVEFSKIPSFCYEDTMENWEKKSFSLNANLTQAPMTDMDKVNAVTAVFNHFGKIRSTVMATGLSDGTIRKYVKVARLPPPLRVAVETGEVGIVAALDASDIHDYDADNPDNTDASVIVSTAKEMQKLVGKQKKRVKEIKKEQPNKSLDEIIEEVKSVPRKTREITIKIETGTYDRINLYKDTKDEIVTIPLATVELVEDGLTANNL